MIDIFACAYVHGCVCGPFYFYFFYSTLICFEHCYDNYGSDKCYLEYKVNKSVFMNNILSQARVGK